MNTQLPQRIERVRALLAHEMVDALVTNKTEHLFYLTGIDHLEGHLFISPRTVILLCDGRYIGRTDVLREWGIEPVLLTSFVPGVQKILSTHAICTCAIESAVLTVHDYERWYASFPDVTWKPLYQAIETLRMIKDDDEIERITQACILADQTWNALLPQITSGISELAVAWTIEKYLREHGADDVSFAPIVAAGEHAAIPHHIPSERPLAVGDMVIIDFGAKLNGYCSDMTRTTVIGQADQWQRDVYESVLQAQEKALSEIKPGMTGMEADAVARMYLEEQGYGDAFSHSLGHGVGLEIHEAPRLSKTQTEVVLEEGMIVTIEPGVYLAGKGGVRIEDTVVVEKNGLRRLTNSPKKLVEIT